MKNKSIFIISIIGIFISIFLGTENTFSQSGILSVNPPSAFQGEVIHLIIQGHNTDFVQENTKVIFPENTGIIIKSTLVNNPELITLLIEISKKATTGPFIFKIKTETQEYIVDGEFEITELASDPEVMVTVYPIQTVYLSDFDFSNLRNLPLLFTISVYSAENSYLRVYVELMHESYGIIASADKELINPGPIVTFDNREFDNYDIDKASDEIIESTTNNGTIPPGVYTYSITLFGPNNVLIQDNITSEFFISESVTGIDLIAPGMSLDSDPEVIFTNTPFFQWFGGLLEYNLSLFEILDDQFTADDIISNIPVFQLNGIASASYLYPNFAETLIEGRRYAWQITSSILTSGGSKEIRSEVFWFIYQRTNVGEKTLDNINLYPDDIDLKPGDSIQINVDGFDINGDKLEVDCEWKLIPPGLGRINKKGWFIAGYQPGTIAVSATCATKEDYITINIIENK